MEGIVEGINVKSHEHPKYGTSYNIGLLIGDNWYNGFGKKTPEQIGVAKGDSVSFNLVAKGQYENIDWRSFRVVATPQVTSKAVPQAKPAYTKKFNEAGIKVGHALNNAVQIAVAQEKLTEDNIVVWAKVILKLGRDLEANFDSIISESKVEEQEAAQAAYEQPQASDGFDDEIPFN